MIKEIQHLTYDWHSEYWVNPNDKRDRVYDAHDWLTGGSVFDKAMLLDNYTRLYSFAQYMHDMESYRVGRQQSIYIGADELLFPGLLNSYKSAPWRHLVEVFGKAHLWDELLKHFYSDTDEMMRRLGYRWVSNEEE
ncbi:recombination system host exonuclease inhibitor [Lactiplantibacillus pentosus]|uniref:recombination system host exonuclease inhibitor n=1 Tax=Lactiplantibacillus pentosus TaxID=1589 RepID=UPI00133066F4|nr:hypothetical protein [Lactiplantibacillus pentosus]